VNKLQQRAIERGLLRDFGERVARLGFSSRPIGQTFLKPMHGGVSAAHLSFIEHENDFDVTVDVAIRFDAVEELVNQSNSLLSPKEKSATFTLGVELGNLLNGRPNRFTVSNSNDVATVSQQIVESLKEVGIPYIERFSNPNDAYEILSRDDHAAWLHSPIHSERAKRACAFLVVLGRRSELQAISERKLSFLESVQDPCRTAVSKFCSSLK